MGAIRLFLAVAVLQSHIRSEILAPNDIAIDNRIVLGVNGGYSVMLFFVVSGFLMSFVLDTKYNREGVQPFFIKLG
jgi:peptidoglycan/LPS O-acetylase OafA/YrhL